MSFLCKTVAFDSMAQVAGSRAQRQTRIWDRIGLGGFFLSSLLLLIFFGGDVCVCLYDALSAR